MNHISSTFETPHYPPPTGMSEVDSFSDSDWLDISSTRESDDNDSIISADSDHKIGVVPLSRRSSMSVGSSREDDVEAWEGFIDDSGDEGARNLEGGLVPATSEAADQDDHDAIDPVLSPVPAHPEIAEEQRVKEALDQSLISTLSASRSNSGSTHNSLRDLRLSFPDPLTSSKDELHRSYNNISPSETHSTSSDLATDIVCDEYPDSDDVTAERLVDPQSNHHLGSFASTPDISHQKLRFSPGDNKAEFEIILYGSPSPVKWTFVEELVQKLVTVSSRTVYDLSIGPDNSTRYLHLERKIDVSLSISEFVAIHDRTTEVSGSQVIVERPSLAIIYLPAPLHSVPEHTLYLPVLAPSTSSDELESLARITAYQDWENLQVPSVKTACLNSGTGSPVFDHRGINQVPRWRARQLLQHLNNTQAKKRPIKSISDHLNSVHAVTLFALVSLIVGFAVNTAFRTPSAASPAPATTSWKIFGTEVNHTTVLATTVGPIKPVVTTSIKNVALSVITPVTTSLIISSSRSAVGTISVLPKVESVEPKPFAWVDKAKSAKDVIVRPTTDEAAETKPSTSMIPHAQSVAGPSKPTSLSLRVVDTLSEVLDTKVKPLVDDVRLDELKEAIDGLCRAIRRQTHDTMQQSKGKAKAIRDHVVYRNDRARGKAKELRKLGEEIIGVASEQFKSRTVIAKKKARDIGQSLSTLETWRGYQTVRTQWVARLKERVGDAERQRSRMNKCRRRSKSRIERKLQRSAGFFGCQAL